MLRTLSLVCICLVAFSLATPIAKLNPRSIAVNGLSDSPDLDLIVRAYMNFGAADQQVDYNCTAWAQLFNSDGIRNTPGMPPSQGWDKLTAMCELVRGQFDVLLCDDEIQIDVVSYNAEKRTAFSWTINGVLKSTGQQVTVPVITNLFMDKDGTIQNAWDFLDPSPFGLPAVGSVLDNELGDDINVTEIVRQYMNFGGFPNYPAASNCTQWANLFNATGIRNFPGTPPLRGFDKLFQECQSIRSQFSTMLNYASLTLPATSWNNEKRVAFVWGVEGVLNNGTLIQRQAISSLFLWRNGTIQFAWDFVDPSGIRPPDMSIFN